MTEKRQIFAADLFCGAGGTSKGLVEACRAAGIEVNLVAVNHWKVAIATHKKNICGPGVNATHVCDRIQAVNPLKLVPGGHLDILAASPECVFHSRARGGKPINDQRRTTAWRVTKWMKVLDIDSVIIENVPEFEQWGPLMQKKDKNGNLVFDKKGRPVMIPDPAHRGEIFQRYIKKMRDLGYNVEYKVMNSADYGAFTSRRRLFIRAAKKGGKIIWPNQTHSKVGKDGKPTIPDTLPWNAARKIIDWKLEGQSIFSRKKPLSEKTMQRIVRGLEKFGGRELKPFIVKLRGTSTVSSIEEPIHMLSGSTNMALAEPRLDHACIVDMFGRDDKPDTRIAGMDGPVPTLPCSNRVGVARAFIVPPLGYYARNGDANAPRSVEDPLQTVIASRGGGHLVEAELVPDDISFTLGQQTNAAARNISEPLATIATAGAISRVSAELKPFVVSIDHNTKAAGGVSSVENPLSVISSKARHAVVAAELTPDNEKLDGQKNSFIAQYYGQSIGSSVDAPLPSQTGKVKSYLVGAFITQNFGERNGQEPRCQSIENPLSAPTSAGAGNLATAHLVEYYGNGQPRSIEEPLGTISTKDRFALVQPVVDGWKLDIKFRMLQPHELAAAMGLPDYEFAGTKTEQVKQIGNAVEGHNALALCYSALTGNALPPQTGGMA
ncbi:MAG: DNA cytosine methyltransferase [Candidatus Thermoplasmatota archaeon]|nr:DNA cytosine methyltransferase [Candidatus Thermoplasmatota archaeon]